MRPCEVFVKAPYYEVILRAGRSRRKLMEFLEHLRHHPHTSGDYRDRDVTLREREVKVVGDYAVTYWFDAPVNIVMVVKIRKADG